jgi:hypothetical protein
VIVANTRKVRLIYESDRKNDRLDARMLARLGRVDASLLSPVWHPSAEAQADLAMAAIQHRSAMASPRLAGSQATRTFLSISRNSLARLSPSAGS